MTDNSINHLIRVTHHDTGHKETVCGVTLTHPKDSDPAYPHCMECIVEAINMDRQQSIERDNDLDALFNELQTVVNKNSDAANANARTLENHINNSGCRPSSFHITIAEYDSLTLRLELFERELGKMKLKNLRKRPTPFKKEKSKKGKKK